MDRKEAIKVLNMVEAYGIAEEAKQMAISALEQLPKYRKKYKRWKRKALELMPEVTSTMQTGQFSFAELTKGMREVTPEESKSIEEYLSRTSKKTGVNIFDLEDVEDEIDFVQEHKKIPVKLDLEPCEDAVSRGELLSHVLCEGISCNECSFNEIDGVSGCLLEKRVFELPSVTQQTETYVDGIHAMGYREGYKDAKKDLERQTGHWIDADGDNAICGCCNRLNHLYGAYCKHCGADMRGKE